MSDSEIFLADIDHLSDYGIRICQIGPQAICLEVVEKKDGAKDYESKSEQVIVSGGGLFRALTTLEQDKIVREAERDRQSFDYDWKSLEIHEDGQITAPSGIRSKQCGRAED